jgi:hypothetical protein
MAYIYMIINNINNKVYVGKTEGSIEKRFQEHCADSRKEHNKNRPLYRAMNKYGVENFAVSLLEETDQPEIREDFWIAQKQSYHNGYNATRGGDGKKYLDYDLIYNTYCEIQNAARTAEILNISIDTVLAVIHQRGIRRSSAEVAKLTLGKPIKMFSLLGIEEKSFLSVKDAAAYVQAQGFTKIQNQSGVTKVIRQCANGNRKTACKKLWQWI